MSAMNSPFALTQWQKKQAANLYHFVSMEYLKGLQQRVNDLIAFVEPRSIWRPALSAEKRSKPAPANGISWKW
ncbi:MAG: hypothetical protein V4754_09210 [Pseudomonadota bacterium]